jgi:hypothetical protein
MFTHRGRILESIPWLLLAAFVCGMARSSAANETIGDSRPDPPSFVAAPSIANAVDPSQPDSPIPSGRTSDVDVPLLPRLEPLGLLNQPLSGSGLRVSGWLDMGYTYATSGAGRLAVAPQMNRFGQEYLFNQLALTFDRPLSADTWSWGYYLQFFSGADASTLEGPGDIRNTDPRFGGSIRQARVQAHLPIFSERGIDMVFGRQGSLMGYESYMAPLRSFYSLSYQWFYAEDGADTGWWTTLHAADRWDITYGVYLGSNTFFTLQGDAPSHELQIKRWLDEEHKFYHCATLVVGDNSVGKTVAVLPGRLATVLEWRIQAAWSDRWTQVLQANIGWDEDVRFIGLGRWHGVLTGSVFKLDEKLDAQSRLEWFDDVNGTRTGHATNYFAVTTGLAARLGPKLMIRPELRGDFAGSRVFGPVDSPSRRSSQLTAALECVLPF